MLVFGNDCYIPQPIYSAAPQILSITPIHRIFDIKCRIYGPDDRTENGMVAVCRKIVLILF